MTVHTFGDPSAGTVLIQPVDRRDLELIGNEIKDQNGKGVCVADARMLKLH